MQQLKKIYGYCIIPKNIFLFRGHTDKSFDDCMFFGTKYSVATAFNDTIQVWKTTTDIEVLFLVEYLTGSSWTISALPRLYNSIFPADSNPNFNDLDIKHWDVNRRNKLLQKLFYDYKISGWLTSLENRVEIEVCLFDKQTNSKQLILIDTCDRKNEKYFKDSLQKIKTFPSENFYNQTTEQFDKDSHKQHKRFINAAIKEYSEKGMKKNEAKHYMFDLRTKLEI